MCVCGSSRWGFTLPTAENYCLKLTLGYTAPENAELREVAAAVLAAHNITCVDCTPNGEFEPIALKARDGSLPEKLLTQMRIVSARDEELLSQ